MTHNKYPILAKVLESDFSHEFVGSRMEGIEFLKESIAEGEFALNELKKEALLAIEDNNFDWVEFAIKHKYQWDKSSLSAEDIINHLKYDLWELLFPDQVLDTESRKEMVKAALIVLEQYNENEGWTTLREVHRTLVNQERFRMLDFYNMYHFLEGSAHHIEGKLERGKGREIYHVRKKRK